jgi:polysaccharide chain length determinant protein (PEP-CTERM system associated)
VAVPGSSTEAAIKATESRRSELLLAFTDRHPDIVAINEQLRQLYQQRDTERSAMAGSATGIEGASNATNPVYQTVQIALNNTGVKVAELRSKVNQASATVRQLNKQIETIPEVETRYSELSRNYAQYASLYDELLLRKERERLGNVGEDQDVVSFNIIDPPAADIEPVAPRRALFLVAVLLLGLMGGGAAAFLMHLLNPVFQDARSLHNYTGRPVLGAVSMTWLDRHKVGRRIDVSTFALASTSLVALFIVSILFMDQFSGLMRGLLAPDLG